VYGRCHKTDLIMFQIRTISIRLLQSDVLRRGTDGNVGRMEEVRAGSNTGPAPATFTSTRARLTTVAT